MKSKKPVIFPKHKEILEVLGENIKLARLRRKLTTIQVSERANISRTTLYLIEKGSENVAIGYYFNVFRVLSLQLDFLKLAKDDVFGRKLQDIELLNKKVLDNLEFKKTKQTYIMINNKGHVKIGKSYNPKIRESTLQSEQPCIKLIAVVNLDIENILHEEFKDKRIRGEWFELSNSEIVDIIEKYGFIEIENNENL